VRPLPGRLLTDMDRAGGEPTGPALAPGTWRVPRPVLAGSLTIALILMAPLAIVYAASGTGAVLAVGMGYTGSLTPALKLRPTYSLALAIPAALTGVVGVALQRIVATLLGALLAAGIALGLWRLDQWRQQT